VQTIKELLAILVVIFLALALIGMFTVVKAFEAITETEAMMLFFTAVT
jgi:hypothetical protein